jgi:hypothetical protein
MKVIARTNSKGQNVILRSNMEGECPLQCINDYDETGYKTISWSEDCRIYEDRMGNQIHLDLRGIKAGYF